MQLVKGNSSFPFNPIRAINERGSDTIGSLTRYMLILADGK